MPVSLGELVLRRKLESRAIPGFGGNQRAYVPGQYAAVVTGDDAILSYVDNGGWAVQLFCTYREGEWVLKTDIFFAINPYGIEARRIPISTPLRDELVRALDDARKRKAPRSEKREASAQTTE